MKILISSKNYQHKPTGAETGEIQNTIMNNFKNVNLDQFIELIEKGHTFIPAFLHGTATPKNESYITQDSFAIDVDHSIYTYEEFISLLKNHIGIVPSYIYATHSFSETNNSYRLCFALDRNITLEERNIIYNYLRKKLIDSNNKSLIDTNCFNASRLFYAGKKTLHRNDEMIKTDVFLNYITCTGISSGNLLEVSNKIMTEYKFNSTLPSCITELLYIPNPQISNTKNETKKTKSTKKQKSSNTKKSNIDNALRTTTNGIEHYTNKVIESIKKRKLNLPEEIAQLLTQGIDFSKGFEALKEISISKFLKLPYKVSFNCILGTHSDNNPSANIFTNEFGIELYHCFAENKTLDFIGIIQNLLNTSKGDTINYIINLFYLDSVLVTAPEKITDFTNKVIKNNMDIINNNQDNYIYKELLDTGLLKVYETILRYGESYNNYRFEDETILANKEKNISEIIAANQNFFFAPIKKLQEVYYNLYNESLNEKTMRIKINRLASFGFIEKYVFSKDSKYIPEDIFEKQLDYLDNNSKKGFSPNYFTINKIDKNLEEKYIAILKFRKKYNIKINSVSQKVLNYLLYKHGLMNKKCNLNLIDKHKNIINTIVNYLLDKLSLSIQDLQDSINSDKDINNIKYNLFFFTDKELITNLNYTEEDINKVLPLINDLFQCSCLHVNKEISAQYNLYGKVGYHSNIYTLDVLKELFNSNKENLKNNLLKSFNVLINILFTTPNSNDININKYCSIIKTLKRTINKCLNNKNIKFKCKKLNKLVELFKINISNDINKIKETLSNTTNNHNNNIIERKINNLTNEYNICKYPMFSQFEIIISLLQQHFNLITKSLPNYFNFFNKIEF